MMGFLLTLLILGPVVWGILAWVTRAERTRSAVVLVAGLSTIVAGVLLATRGSADVVVPHGIAAMGKAIEPLIILVVLFIALQIRSGVIAAMSAVQLVLALMGGKSSGTESSILVVDPLSVILVLIISVIGSIICIYGIGYMRKHEEHHPASHGASPGRFFFFLVAFLGFMNGLVLTDDIRWLTIFWEATTLCSFFLIGHDGTDEAKASARRALLINTFGGLAMVCAAWLVHHRTGSESLRTLLTGQAGAVAFLPLALFSLAAFTKSAQMPFQSWLLGAMVAPTPVSALLHSSTMVKAGSYLILRLAPGIVDTKLAAVIAFAGAFTFAITSGLAVGQSNAKKVLAYSTIANLGLIAACAVIDSPLAFSAALMLLVFHALSKALLFMCVGAIEQSIGSREIEDMSGILFRMPLTTTITGIAMASMMVPPFGMLIGKWMAIEASVQSAPILFLFIMGSALTVLFWAKWLGRITTASYHPVYTIEKIAFSIRATLIVLLVGVAISAFAAMPLYRWVIRPISVSAYQSVPAVVATSLESVDDFMAWPLCVVLGLVILSGILSRSFFKESSVRLPYLCGENIHDPDVSFAFRSLMDKKETALVSSYYLTAIFEEAMITRWANPVAAMILITWFGILAS
jgi:ech hydrogenase subunit A